MNTDSKHQVRRCPRDLFSDVNIAKLNEERAATTTRPANLTVGINTNEDSGEFSRQEVYLANI